MLNTTVNKAVFCFLTGLVSVAALFVPGVTDWASPEIIQGITAIVTTAVVYFVPNKPA